MAQKSDTKVADSSAAAQQEVVLSVPSRKVSAETIKLKEVIMETFPHGFEHDNLMEAVIRAMRHLARKHRRLTGQQKKKLIVDALLLVLDETNSGALEVFEPLVKSMIPTVVDNLIDVEKGKIKLNKKGRSCLSMLCCCGVCC
jgi:hypothetical protein